MPPVIDTSDYRRITAAITSPGAAPKVVAAAIDDRIAVTCTAVDPVTGQEIEISAVPDTGALYEDQRGIWVTKDGAHSIRGTEDMGQWRADGCPLPVDLLPDAAIVRPLIEAAHEAEQIPSSASGAVPRKKGTFPPPTLHSGNAHRLDSVVEALNVS